MRTYCGIREASVRFDVVMVWLLISWMKKLPRSMNIIRAVSTMAADRTDRVAKMIPISE